MTARFDALGIVVSDMAATLAFYGLLGLDFDEDPEAAGHMEAKLPGGPIDAGHRGGHRLV